MPKNEQKLCNCLFHSAKGKNSAINFKKMHHCVKRKMLIYFKNSVVLFFLAVGNLKFMNENRPVIRY